VACFRSCECCVKLVKPLLVEANKLFLINEVVEPRVPVGYDEELKFMCLRHKRSAFEDCIETAAVATAGEDADFFHCVPSPSLLNGLEYEPRIYLFVRKSLS